MNKKFVAFATVLLVMLLNRAFSQDDLSCRYMRLDVGYSCLLSIINPHGFDNFTTINGEHLQGMSNDDVRSILFDYDCYTTNIPSIICETFKNIVYFRLEDNIIEEITENSFKYCKILGQVDLSNNKIGKISENAFVENPEFLAADFSNNRLRDLPKSLFMSTNNLQFAKFRNNYLTTIDSEIFGDQPKMQWLELNDNFIDAVDEKILDRTSIYNMRLEGNVCSNSNLNDYSQDRVEMRAVLRTCFDNFKSSVGSSSSQRLHCNYYNIYSYGCTIVVENPYGWDNFTDISGFHILEFSDDNLKEIKLNQKSHMTLFPSIVCDKFKNIEQIDLSKNYIKEITVHTFAGCQKLVKLDLSSNELKRISTNAFRFNVVLENLDFSNNLLEDLPINIFTTTRSLRDVSLKGNNIGVLHSDSFGEQPNIYAIYADQNKITAIDEKILNLTSVSTFSLFGNICIDDIAVDHSPEREETKRKLRNCFINYKGREEPFQSIQCEYHYHETLGYACFPMIVNPNGWDNYTNIDGDHFPGYGNDNVNMILLDENPNSPIFPSIICETFKNLEFILYTYSNIEEINDDSFKGCFKLQVLYFSGNRIGRISQNAFRENLELTTVNLSDNLIEELPKNLFATTKSLGSLDLNRNNIRIINSDIFGELMNFEYLYINGNNIIGIDEEILTKTSVSIIDFRNIRCGYGNIEDISEGRVVIREKLTNCFRIFREIEGLEPPAIETYGYLNINWINDL